MIYIIIGTRGHFMKMFPIMKLFDEEKIDYQFIHTCQHYGTVEKTRKRLKVKKPDVYLTNKKEDIKNIGDFLRWAPQVLLNARKLPITKDDFVIVHGDNESTLLAFIIGKFFRAKIVHVEAGIRSGNFLEPFPEEIIRTIVSGFADVCFCPEEEDVKTISGKQLVFCTHGNTVLDSVRMALKMAPSLRVKKLMKTEYVLFSVHRKESLYSHQRLNLIIDILEMILKKGLKVIWPVHKNTHYELDRKGFWLRISELKKKHDLTTNTFFDYVDFMHTIKHCQFMASDGGGMQIETYYVNKPMLILRKLIEMNKGIGETAFLSCLEKRKVAAFLNHYQKFKRRGIIKGSPSKIVVDFFK